MKTTTMFACFLLLVGVLFSCSKEELIIEDTGAADTLDLATDLNVYIDSPFGMYKGVLSTIDSQDRGIVEIKVINDQTAKATVTYINGDVDFFNGVIKQDKGLYTDDVMDIQFNNKSLTSSFDFKVQEDGTNPTIINASSNSTASLMRIVKENTQGAVIPLVGTFITDEFSVTQASGTWSIIFNSGMGEGDQTDITTQTIFNGVDFGSPTGSEQFDCVTTGDVTTCQIEGFYTSQNIDIEWFGSHIYLNATDCSTSSGFWDTSNGLSGTFTANSLCPSVNDVCSGATTIACGDSFAGSTTIATEIGDPTDQSCEGDGSVSESGGVWYLYTGIDDGADTIINTEGSDFDTQLFLYTGSCEALVCINSDDEGNLDSTSQLRFNDVPGEDYYIYVTGFENASGNYVISITCPTAAPTCSGTVTDVTGAIGVLNESGIDNQCTDGNPDTFIATSNAIGTIGSTADIDNVTINVSAFFSDEIELSLRSPIGTELILKRGILGEGLDDFTDTVFRDGGGDIAIAEGPYTGEFTPEGNTFATAFAGESITGDWTLSICDSDVADGGELLSWSIGFCDGDIPSSFSEPTDTVERSNRISDRQKIARTNRSRSRRRTK